MRYSFLIIDDNTASSKEISSLFDNFQNYFCVGTVKNDAQAIQQIYSLKPHLVLISLKPEAEKNQALFSVLAESHQYLETAPYCIAVGQSADAAFDAIQCGISDFLLRPLHLHQLGKSLFRFEKKSPPSLPSSICIKSYSDYQFVQLQDIVYLKADNNTTDIKLYNDKTVNAFKTLKHFENTLPFYFLRIHKSYIVNINYVSRIHFSKSKCYLNYNEILPFSLSYRANIDAIINKTNI